MKKRSVLSAVAMLLVSALVLTSATYAWFAASDTAAVNSVIASVTNDAGSLLLRAYNYDRGGSSSTWLDTWSTSLSASDFGDLADTLKPISLNVYDAGAGVTSVETYKVLYDGQYFTDGGATVRNGVAGAGDYLWYQFQVEYTSTSEAPASEDVLMDITFSQNEDFQYGLLNITSTDPEANTGAYLFGQTTSGDYTPLDEALTGPVLDVAVKNSIVDALDTPALNYTLAADSILSNALVDDAETDINIFEDVDVDSGSVTATVTVFVWAEGNNANCYGAVPAAGAGFTFGFELV